MFITVDVEKAFLQGMTHEEIEASTGEVQRRAFFDLPPGSAAVLRQIPGYEDFDERYECLMSLKHGTGTKGAPRAFSLKLASVTQGPKCRTKSITYDGKLELRFDDNALTAIATKPVDDIKIGGVPKIVRGQIIPALKAVFGKLTTHEEEFTNTGVRHKRPGDGTVEVDQD